MPLKFVCMALLGIAWLGAGEFVELQISPSVTSNQCLYVEMDGDQTNQIRTQECWRRDYRDDGSGTWAIRSEGHIQPKALQDLCLSVPSNKASEDIVSPEFRPCEISTKWNWNATTKFISESSGNCLFVKDPFDTMSAEASWGWSTVEHLDILVADCTRIPDKRLLEFDQKNLINAHTHQRSTNRNTTVVTVVNAAAVATKPVQGFVLSCDKERFAINLTLGSTFTYYPENGQLCNLTYTNVNETNPFVVFRNIATFTKTNILIRASNGAEPNRIKFQNTNAVITDEMNARLRMVDATDSPAGIKVLWSPTDCNRCVPRVLFDLDDRSYQHDYITVEAQRCGILTAVLRAAPVSIHHCFGGGSKLTVLVRTSTVSLIVDRESGRIWLPLVIAAVILIGLAILANVAWWCGRHMSKRSAGTRVLGERLIDNENLGPHATQATLTTSKSTRPNSTGRLKSLDTFRGIALVVMMFVNFGGGGYHFFQHSLWDGLTVADLVFPWFIWIMGVSSALSLQAAQNKETKITSLVRKALQRTIVLFCLGAFLTGQMDWQRMRIMGVLQYFAISYFFITMVAILGPKYNPVTRRIYFLWYSRSIDPNRRFSNLFTTIPLPTDTSRFREFIPWWPEWVCIAILPLIGNLLATLLPVPGCPTGYLGPGGLYGSEGRHPYCTGGAHRYVDVSMFGLNHVYHSPTAQDMYGTGAYDPEGVLGAFNAVLIAFHGLQVGRIFLSYPSSKSRCVRLLLWSLSLCLVAGLFSMFSQYDGAVPVNKNMWSISFALVMCGFACFVMCVVYVLVDVRQWWSGEPVIAVGMNSLFVYVMHEHFDGVIQPFGFNSSQTHASLLANHLWMVAFWCLAAAWLRRNKIFIHV
eukprot:c16384_g1_i2.p1 GENE.c16384_g1_i2~~c16384_g1_i2.p1  ORF type:complete len:867 (+),score=180.26 c16384_g1_i2:32-2632(+)